MFQPVRVHFSATSPIARRSANTANNLRFGWIRRSATSIDISKLFLTDVILEFP